MQRFALLARLSFHWWVTTVMILGLGSKVLGADLRISDLRLIEAGSTWRIEWNSTPGLDYQLQRAMNDSLPTVEWIPLATVRAIGAVTGADDIASPGLVQRYFRVLQLPAGPADTEPPHIVYNGVQSSTISGGLPGLRVRFLATDNVGVARVNVFEKSQLVGHALPTGSGDWVLTLPARIDAFDPRLFTGVAIDPSGNSTESIPGGVLTANPDQFVPLDTNGVAREGAFLSASATNQARPFIFRPGGRLRPGAAPDLIVTFPDGATFHETGNETTIEFVRVSAAFSTDSPLRLNVPLHRESGAPKQLRVGPLRFDDLAALFDQDPASGLGVTAFGRFPLRWRGGVIDDRGMPGAQFRPEISNLPLPGFSDNAGVPMIEFAADRSLRVGLSGEFKLPDGSANSPSLIAGPGLPLRLTLRPDGEISLSGSVEARWTNGQNVRAELRLDDPIYRLSIAANALKIQAVSNLVDLLPNNPDICVPASATAAQLSQATRCLDSFARAYGNFSALVASSASNAPISAAEPPQSINGVSAALEAWGFSALSGAARILPLDQIAELVRQNGREASAAPELPELLAHRLALTRARAALQVGGLNGSATAQAQLTAALAEAEAAALDRVRSSDAVLSLASMKQTARLLVETEAIRQEANLPSGQLLAELPGLFQRFSDKIADDSGVAVNVFTPIANPAIKTMNRFTAMERLRDLVDLQANAQLIGVNLSATRTDELSGQIGVRLLDTINAALNVAESAADLPSFILAAQDFTELVSWVQLGLFPFVPQLATIGEGSALTALADRINSLAQIELGRPLGLKTLGRQAQEIRALLAVLRQMPGRVTFAAEPFRRAFDAMENRLNEAASAPSLAAVTNQLQMIELLEAGLLHREFAVRFGFAQPVNWETNRLPVVVGRLRELAAAQRGWRELDQAVRLLMNAADRAGLVNDQDRRRAYLAQTAAILGTARTVARALLQDATGSLRTVDMALPGDMFIDQPAGYASFNRESGTLHGGISGRLRLPKYRLSLTVPNASIGNDGRFDLSAFGLLTFQGGQFSVPARQPLHIWNNRRGVAFEGSARLNLDNGLRFDTSVSLVDPRYAFQLSARGVELNLGKQLILQRPVLSSAAFDHFGDSVRDAFGDYFTGLNGALETLASAAGSFPPVDETGFGKPPEFVAPEISFDFASLNAWSAGIIANTRAGLSNAVQVLNPVLEAVDHLNQDARTATNALGDEIAKLADYAARMQLLREMKQASEQAAAAQLAGADDLHQLDQLLLTGATINASNIVALLTPDLPNRLGDSLDVVRLLYDAEATLQAIGAGNGNQEALAIDPCAAYTNATASLHQRAEALSICAARREAGRVGLNPLSGNIANTNIFNGLSEFEISVSARLLVALEAQLQEEDAPGAGQLSKLVPRLLFRQRELLLFQLTNAPGISLSRTIELTRLLMNNASAMQLAEVPEPDIDTLASLLNQRLATALQKVPPAEIDRAKKEADLAMERRERELRTEVGSALGSDRVVQVVAPDAGYQPDFLTQLNDFFRVAGMPVPDGIKTNVDALVRFKVQELRARPFTPDFLTNRLAETQALFSGLIGLTDWAGFRMTNDFNVLTNLQLNLASFTHSLTTVAEAQKAWWLISRYAEALRLHSAIYGTNLVVGLNSSVTQARNEAILAASRVAGALAALVDAVQLEDVVLPLPGKVSVDRVSGRLVFNRETGFLQGCFGGTVRFPEVNTNLFFQISDACLANDGGYSISGAMGAPLPLGQAQLRAALSVVGSSNGVALFTGGGTLSVPNLPSTNRVFDVGLSYNQPERRLGFDLQGNNLDLRLSEDFVLFGAGIGFDMSTASPQGAFRATGSAGMFARQKPLPTVIGGTNFQLVVEQLTTVFNYSTNGFSVGLSNGVIHLPDFFHNGACPTNASEPATGAQLALVPANPILVSIGTGSNPAAAFSGALDFRNVGFNIPGLTNFSAEVCSARLSFRSNALPIFNDLNATLLLPLPNGDSIVDITGVTWALDGFPTEASVSLRHGFRLLDLDGFSLDFQTNSALSFTSTVSGNGRRTSVFSLIGGLRGTVRGDLLANAVDNSAFSFGTSGSFRWETDQLPTLGLDTVTFGGRIKLGGAGGVELVGVDGSGIPAPGDPNSLASISLNGLQNVFNLAPDRPFQINVSGALGTSDFVFFGLRDARLVFDGVNNSQNPEPTFAVSSVGFRQGDHLKLLGIEKLPVQLRAGSVTFITDGIPLGRLFAPTNLIFTLTGDVNISLTPPDANNPASPRLFGAVSNLQVRLPNGFAGLPSFSVDTLALALENLTIGDMAGLSGGLAVGNLNNPTNLFFAGTVGGSYNGVGIKAIIATRLDGLIGLCLAVNAGPAGIPLDGGTLGGILLTGAEGGVSFLNQFTDPCDFKAVLGLNDDGTPGATAARSTMKIVSGPKAKVSEMAVLSWEELHDLQRLHEKRKAIQSTPRARAQFAALSNGSTRTSTALSSEPAPAPATDCPTGDCPPSTMNLLCQRHPSAGEDPSEANYGGRYRDRTIFRFTSLDRNTVDQILTSAGIGDLSGNASVIAGSFANGARDLISNLIPRPPNTGSGADINEFIDGSLEQMRGFVARSIEAALTNIGGVNLREALYEAAYAGVKCADITIQLKGTFSYAPVSVALSAVGGAVASTTGTAGILGSVNLFGLPVGTGEFFYSLTDTNGLPNPSLCGGVRAAVGPLELGQMGLAIGCDECITGTLIALQQFVAGLTGDIAGSADTVIRALIRNAAPANVSLNLPLNSYFGPLNSSAVLNQDQQIAVLTGLLNLPKTAEFLRSHPAVVNDLGRNAVLALEGRTMELILAIYNSTNPRLQFCGNVEPKIFGFSLTGGNSLVAATLSADKQNIRGGATFSPSYVFGNLPFFIMSAGTINNVVPALDEATMGFSVGLPLINQPQLQLLSTNPARFASGQFSNFLANASLTFGYELSPFGFKLADGEGRILLPTIENHPDNPLRHAARPADYGSDGKFRAPTSPDRATILAATLNSNVLAEATWTGRGSDLAALFPPGSAFATAVGGRELGRDYFPHGGFLGAAKVQFPRPLTDAPPFDQLTELFSPVAVTNLLDRLNLAQSIFTNYVMGSREIGSIALFVPFPNPPPGFWALQQGPKAFIDAIANFDEKAIIEQGLNIYPAEQLLMRGNVNVQLLGLPLGTGQLIADPSAGLFRITAGVPQDSWLSSFVQGGVTGEVRTAEYILHTNPNQLPPGVTTADLQPDARLLVVSNALRAAFQSSSTPAQKEAAINDAIARITDTLPKASVAAGLDLKIPKELEGFMKFNSGAGFFAFSPRFEPGYSGLEIFPDSDPANPGPYTLARRNGGIVAGGHFTFGFNLDDKDTNRRLTIDIPEMTLGITGSSSAKLFPALNGRVKVNEITLPNAFKFNGSTTPPFQLKNGLLAFNSSPAVGSDFLNVAGKLTPIDLGPFLRVRPLPAGANPGNLLGGSLRITKNEKSISAAISINPAEGSIPMFGPSLKGLIYGSTDGVNFTPFTFSTVPGQPWSATLRLQGALEIRSPLDVNSAVLFRAEPVSINGNQVPFEAQIAGTGLEKFEIRLTIPNGLTFTLYPGTDRQSVFQVGDNSATCLFVNNEGRLYFDSGTRTLDLNGVASVRGRIEFGFEPVDRTPLLGAPLPVTLTTQLGHSVEQKLSVTNRNTNACQLVLDASVSDSVNFSVLPNRLLLGPGQTGELRMRFTPKSAGTFARQLVLANNSTQPVVNVAITGIVTALPKMHVQLAAINFGSTPLGSTRSQAVRVSNLGDAPLLLTNILTTAAPFTNDVRTLTISPGGFRDIIASFTPFATAATNGLLKFSANDPSSPAGQLTLTGSGSDRFWFRERRGFGLDHLEDIDVKTNGAAFTVGLKGAFLRHPDGMRAWTEDFQIKSPDLTALTFINNNTGWMVGSKGLVQFTSNGGATWAIQKHPLLVDAQVNWRAVALLEATTSRMAFAGESGGLARIVIANSASQFTAGFVPPAAKGIRGLAFSPAKVGVAVGDGATILRSVDDGKTWQLIAAPGDVPSTTALRSVTGDPADNNNFIIVGDNGLILRTTNAGQTWARTPSATTENLYAVVRAGSSIYAAGNNGTVRRSTTSTGSSWAVDETATAVNFRGLGSSGAEVWAVSADGDILHRLTTAIGGPLAVVNATDLDFGQVALNEIGMREIVVANEGTANLTAELKSDDKGFVVSPAGQKTIPPGQAALFTVTFSNANKGAFGTTVHVETSDKSAGKIDLPVSAKVDGSDFTPLGYALLPATIDFGTIVAGTDFATSVGFANLGDTNLVITGLNLRTDETNLQHSFIQKSADPVPPLKQVSFQFNMRPNHPGILHGQIEVLSDGRNGVAMIDFVANVVPKPDVVVIDSTPHGITAFVNGVPVVTPAAFSIVDGSPSAGQLQRGKPVVVQANATHTADGVPYEFQRWEPGSGTKLTFVSGNGASKFVARYAQSTEARSAVAEPPLLLASPCTFTAPLDVAFGPWVKISEARMTLPWLGDGTTGSNFKVEGALFLSLSRAYGSLSSSRIRVLVPTNAPAFKGVEMLEITPGSWNFDLQSGLFKVNALSPGLQVMNASTLPPANLRIEVNVQSTANRRAFVRFTTLDDLPIAPGLLALGAGSAEFGVGLTLANASAHFELNGTFRALANPEGNGYLINRGYNFVFDPTLPLTPITFTSRTQLADLAVMRLFAQPGAKIGPTLSGSVFGLTADKVALEFFQSGEFIDTTTTIQSDGTFSFSATPPSAGLSAGIIRLKPQSTSDKLLVTANPLQGTLLVDLPAMFINSLGAPALWPNDKVLSKAFSFDSENFSVRLPLPAIDFASLPMGKQPVAGVDEDNYFEFIRRDGKTGIGLRSRQDLIFGALELALSINDTRVISGNLSGRIGLEGPSPLDAVSDRISMSYHSSRDPEFIMNRFFLGFGCRFQMGSNVDFGGKACVLDLFSDKPLEARDCQ